MQFLPPHAKASYWRQSSMHHFVTVVKMACQKCLQILRHARSAFLPVCASICTSTSASISTFVSTSTVQKTYMYIYIYMYVKCICKYVHLHLHVDPCSYLAIAVDAGGLHLSGPNGNAAGAALPMGLATRYLFSWGCNWLFWRPFCGCPRSLLFGV